MLNGYNMNKDILSN